MLDTRFPRPVGDIGNPASFPFPVLYRRIERASARDAVRGDADSLYDGFVAGALALVEQGAVAISTSCGFLCGFQQRFESALPVPVLTSSLIRLDRIQSQLPVGRRVGVLTIDAEALAARHRLDAAIIGLPRDSHLSQTIFEDLPNLDAALAEAEMLAAAQRLKAAEPNLGAILLECTNMGPYAQAIRDALGLPVTGIVDLLTEMRAP